MSPTSEHMGLPPEKRPLVLMQQHLLGATGRVRQQVRNIRWRAGAGVVRMAGGYGRCKWSETLKREAIAQRGGLRGLATPLLLCWKNRSLAHAPPGTQNSAQASPPI